MSSFALKLALLAGVGVLVLLLALAAIWFFVRRRRRRASKFGFTAAAKVDKASPALLNAKRDETFIKTEKFIAKRGQRVAEVLVDYVSTKGLQHGVYMARPRPNACVWWVGEKYPVAPKSVLAAVHVGLGTVHGFRSKVVVLAEISEADALSRALGRAAKPRSSPSRTDGWNMPITFPGFPLRAGDGVEIAELRAPVVDQPSGQPSHQP